MRADFGAPSLSARIVIEAVIIKHMRNIDHHDVVEQIRENMYLQYFIGLSSFQTSAPFDASLMVSIRKRLSKDVIDQFNEEVLRQAGVLRKADQEAIIKSGDQSDNHGDDLNTEDQGRNGSTDIQHNQPLTDSHAKLHNVLAKPGEDKAQATAPLSGTLLVNATVAEQQIQYPTELKLLNESREQLERIITKVCEDLHFAYPRMYKHKARRQCLLIAKKKRKTKRDLRRGIRQQLQYLKSNLGYVDDLVEKHSPLFV